MDRADRVAVYGIYFDFDKAELKAQSQPTLQEIAKLLGLEPGLNCTWSVIRTMSEISTTR